MTARLKNNQAIQRNPVKFFSDETAIKARLSVSDLTKDNATLIVERALIKTEQGTCWRSDPRLRTLSPYRLTSGQAQQFMSDIQCPVKLIYASDGLTLVKDTLSLAKSVISQLCIDKLNGGHHVHMERPDEVAHLLRLFWAANKI
jgi:hypothetical protein